MKHTVILLLFVFAMGAIAMAQKVTRKDVVGTWYIDAVEIKGKRISVHDEASVVQGLYATADKALSHDDSVLYQQSGALLYMVLGFMQFEFFANDTVYGSVKMDLGGLVKTATDTMHYSIKDSKLIMDRVDGKKETVDLTMPDWRTLVFNNFTKSKGKNLIFKRQ